MPRKTNLKLAFLAYLTIVPLIVLLNSFALGFNFHTEYTISRYIGLTYWSAITFALTSVFIFINVLKYLLKVGREYKMNKIWWVIALITIVALIGVGFCPVGLFDKTFGDFGTVSKIHRASAFIMFCSAIPTVFLTALKFRERKSLLVSAIIFVLYGLAFVFCYIYNFRPMMDYILFFEAFFLIFFLINLYLIPEKTEKTKKTKNAEKNRKN